MKNLFVHLFFVMLTLSSCKEEKKQTLKQVVSTNNVKGAWKMKAVRWITKDTTYTIEEAQPGIFIFTDKTYSIMWTPIDTLRTPFKVLSKGTDQELIAGFKSVVFNGGDYIHTDSTVTTTAFIAKVPGFEGGKQFYRYEFDKKILKLTFFDETYPNGDKPEWFGRFVTEFTMERID